MSTGVICEIIKLTIDRSTFGRDVSSSNAFEYARNVAATCGVREQYYGEDADDKDLIFWVLVWGQEKGPCASSTLRDVVKPLDRNSAPQSWHIPFRNDSVLVPALTAPITELCYLHLRQETPRSEIAESLQKSFMDCYQAEGFLGGASDTAKNDDSMYWYVLGWKTRKHYGTYAKSALFFEEVDKLRPHMHSGKGHFMTLIQHIV